MRGFVPCVAAALTFMVGAGSVDATLAQDADLTLTPGTVPAATGFQAVLTGCSAGEVVTFVIEGIDLEPVTAPCTGPGQSASAGLLAPTLGGDWTVTATASTSGIRASTTLNVTGGEEQPDDLPPTGTGSTPIALIGAGLVAVGAALTFIIRFRRTGAVNTSELR